ncbi:MAG: DUF3795 domain-containing protein [Anaerolineales bacterium]|nr:DUF3795 domain-containing protein [Anaerolineales bacterium]
MMKDEIWGRMDWMAACGLDCSECDIRRAGIDPAAADRVLIWFRHAGWLEEGEGIDVLQPRLPLCSGCHGSLETHWSPDCWILKCCVEEHGFHTCAECNQFPCDRLTAWSQERPSYAVALERLHQISVRRNA